ncbi:hypothetical protein G9A89_005419 [Geosiphon pyriformis]|nr:hypothetical protein G9A89_005419 [Geosiphon pyriformis]
MPKEQNFYHTAHLEGRAAAQQQNSSYTLITIPPARIAKNTNLLDIFSFEFKANESPFLLSNAAANKQKAIMAMYTEAKIEGKTIHLILDSGSTGSIITYQLMQQLKRNVNQPVQTVIVTADGMKKTPVGEIDNFLFTLDEITIPVKVFVMDAPHTFNKCSEKALAFEFELEEEKPIIETFMALESTSNWADETEQHALNKLYYYLHDAKMIFNLAMALINRATKEDVRQMKKAEYIEYTMELAGFDYEDEVEVYHQIASHTYPTQEAQIQQSEQMNIRLCKKCIMPCDKQWCPECYTLSIPLSSESDEKEIEFGEPEATEEIETTPIYLIKNQPAL